MTDRELAIKAIRRGVPLDQVNLCSCHTDPPTRSGCIGVCEDAVAAIIAAFEQIRAEAMADGAGSDRISDDEIDSWHSGD